MYQGKYVSQAERPANLPKRRPPRRQKKEISNKTRLFYMIYGISSAVILAIFLILLIPLNAWLVNYEAEQPHQASQEIFHDLFGKKDWKAVYAAAGIEDSAFENADSFAAFMNSKVGDGQLTLLETSAGLSGDRKYVVRLGDEKIAVFTMEKTGEKKDVVWSLKSLDLSELRKESATVIVAPGQTVYVNGIALDSSYTIRTVSTVAENYLPNGVTGYNVLHQYVGGLFAKPEITVKDASGNSIAVTQDEKTGFYTTVQKTAGEISDAEAALATDAAKAHALYMIRDINESQFAKYFDPTSDNYRIIVTTDSFVQGHRDTKIEDLTISDYYRYSDKLFSVRVTLKLSTFETVFNSTKVFPVDYTYFFTKNDSGKWLVTNSVNGNAQDTVEKVRLTFSNDGFQLGYMLVSPLATKLTGIPAVTAPEGQVFAGWAQEVENFNGTTTLRIVFTPDENGEILLSGETKLEPMDLIAVFKTPDGA